LYADSFQDGCHLKSAPSGRHLEFQNGCHEAHHEAFFWPELWFYSRKKGLSAIYYLVDRLLSAVVSIYFIWKLGISLIVINKLNNQYCFQHNAKPHVAGIGRESPDQIIVSYFYSDITSGRLGLFEIGCPDAKPRHFGDVMVTGETTFT
jgi:hypothetical protein